MSKVMGAIAFQYYRAKMPKHRDYVDEDYECAIGN